MAEPLTRYGAVEMLEDGVHLLRQAPPRTLLCYWTGGIPLALGALRFWNDITNPRTTGLACLAESFGMALLLTWMNCWRAVFAGRLRRQLSGASDAPWTRRRIWRLAAVQAFLGASRLVVLPCALAIGFPLAAVMAFYRDAAALSDRGLEPAEVIRRARQLARRGQGQSWILTSLLLLLGLLVMFNVFLTLALLPQLVRMLTGYESVFSRGGPYFLANSMFAAVVVALTWLAFDPYVQAVFGVRGFRAESIETGEDLRAGLRRVRAAAAVLLVVFTLAPALPPRSPRRNCRRPHGKPSSSTNTIGGLPPPADPSAAKAVAHRVYRSRRGRRTEGPRGLGNLIGRFFRWLNDRLGGHPSVQEGPPPALGLNWAIGLLTAAAGLARRVGDLADAAGAPVEGEGRARCGFGHPAGRRGSRGRPPSRGRVARHWPSRCAAEGNPRLALRALYLANLAWLGRREWIAIHPGKTNREYEAELRRRARAVPGARDLFAANVRAFERAWYGCHEATPKRSTASGSDRRRMKELEAAA